MSTKLTEKLLFLGCTLLMTITASKAASLTVQANAGPILKATGDTLMGRLNDSYVLARGVILVSAKEPTKLVSAGATISLDKDAIALITREPGCLRIDNLCENKLDSIKILLDDRLVPLPAGSEFELSSNRSLLQAWQATDQVARRHIEPFVLPNGTAFAVSEYSAPSLFEHVGIMRSLEDSKDKAEKEVFHRVLKLAASLYVLTTDRGSYSTVKTGCLQKSKLLR